MAARSNYRRQNVPRGSWRHPAVRAYHDDRAQALYARIRLAQLKREAEQRRMSAGEQR